MFKTTDLIAKSHSKTLERNDLNELLLRTKIEKYKMYEIKINSELALLVEKSSGISVLGLLSGGHATNTQFINNHLKDLRACKLEMDRILAGTGK